MKGGNQWSINDLELIFQWNHKSSREKEPTENPGLSPTCEWWTPQCSIETSFFSANKVWGPCSQFSLYQKGFQRRRRRRRRRPCCWLAFPERATGWPMAIQYQLITIRNGSNRGTNITRPPLVESQGQSTSRSVSLTLGIQTRTQRISWSSKIPFNKRSIDPHRPVKT